MLNLRTAVQSEKRGPVKKTNKKEEIIIVLEQRFELLTDCPDRKKQNNYGDFVDDCYARQRAVEWWANLSYVNELTKISQEFNLDLTKLLDKAMKREPPGSPEFFCQVGVDLGRADALQEVINFLT